MSTPISPCPFCGCLESGNPKPYPSLLVVYGNGTELLVECEKCGAQGPESDAGMAEEAIALWNKRAKMTHHQDRTAQRRDP